MLSFFPRGVLDEILNLIESVLRVFLPILLFDLICSLFSLYSPSTVIFVIDFFNSMQLILQFFVIDFSATVQDRRLIQCISIDNDLLHLGIENAFSCLFFLVYVTFSLSKIFPQLYIESSYLVYRITATSCMVR